MAKLPHVEIIPASGKPRSFILVVKAMFEYWPVPDRSQRHHSAAEEEADDVDDEPDGCGSASVASFKQQLPTDILHASHENGTAHF